MKAASSDSLHSATVRSNDRIYWTPSGATSRSDNAVWACRNLQQEVMPHGEFIIHGRCSRLPVTNGLDVQIRLARVRPIVVMMGQ
jgi:hypothetical protein